MSTDPESNVLLGAIQSGVAVQNNERLRVFRQDRSTFYLGEMYLRSNCDEVHVTCLADRTEEPAQPVLSQVNIRWLGVYILLVDTKLFTISELSFLKAFH